MRCVFHLETGFTRQGDRDSLVPPILQISAVLPTGETFQTYTNPFLDSPLPLYDALVAQRLDVSSTVERWHFLLFGDTPRLDKSDRVLAEEIEQTLLKTQIPSTATAAKDFESFIRHAIKDKRCAWVTHDGTRFDLKAMHIRALAESTAKGQDTKKNDQGSIAWIIEALSSALQGLTK